MGAWKVGEEVPHVYAVMTNSNAMRRFDAIFCGVCDAEKGNVTIYFCEFKTFKWTETTLFWQLPLFFFSNDLISNQTFYQQKFKIYHSKYSQSQAVFRFCHKVMSILLMTKTGKWNNTLRP